MPIIKVLNFDFSTFEQFVSSKFAKFQGWESLKLPKMTFWDYLNLPKYDFTENLSGSKMFRFQQCQALTSHYESFLSIV